MNPFHDLTRPAELTNKLDRFFRDTRFAKLDAWSIIRRHIKDNPEISLPWVLRFSYRLAGGFVIEQSFRGICVKTLENLLGLVRWEMTSSNINQLINPSSDWYQYENKDIIYIYNTLLSILQSPGFQNLLFQHCIVPNSREGLKYIEELIEHVEFQKENCIQLKNLAELLQKSLDVFSERVRREFREDPDRVADLIVKNLRSASLLGERTTARYRLSSKDPEDQLTHPKKPNNEFMEKGEDTNAKK